MLSHSSGVLSRGQPQSGRSQYLLFPEHVTTFKDSRPWWKQVLTGLCREYALDAVPVPAGRVAYRVVRGAVSLPDVEAVEGALLYCVSIGVVEKLLDARGLRFIPCRVFKLSSIRHGQPLIRGLSDREYSALAEAAALRDGKGAGHVV